MSPVPFSKCLRAKIYSNMNVYFDTQGCQTLLLKESDPLLFSLLTTKSIKRNCFYNHHVIKHLLTFVLVNNIQLLTCVTLNMQFYQPGSTYCQKAKVNMLRLQVTCTFTEIKKDIF